MASVELSRRVERVVAYPPLCEVAPDQRREFHEGAGRRRQLRGPAGQVAGGDLEGGAEPAGRCGSSAATEPGLQHLNLPPEAVGLAHAPDVLLRHRLLPRPSPQHGDSADPGGADQDSADVGRTRADGEHDRAPGGDQQYGGNEEHDLEFSLRHRPPSIPLPRFVHCDSAARVDARRCFCLGAAAR
jgi:hypothetical protein